MQFEVWMSNLREILQMENSPIELQNGCWSLKSRDELWGNLSERLFDSHIETLASKATEVLSEIDPRFNEALDVGSIIQERSTWSVYSKELRLGVAEALAIIGNRASTLKNCSLGKPKSAVRSAVKEILEGADWKIWASLGDILPFLAEADPDEFLRIVESTLLDHPEVFDDLYRKEASGLFSQNHMTGVLWALEALAWNETRLTRVSLVLAHLASRDPGGSWDNRPINSLIDILLPWFPQTLGSPRRRVAAIKAIKRELPDIAWRVLLQLLPRSTQSTSGSYKPRWSGEVYREWRPEVTPEDYWSQVNQYANLAVELSLGDEDRLKGLVDYLDNLTAESLEKLLKYLSSKEFIGKQQDLKSAIWERLSKIVSKHKRFSDAEWAMPKTQIEKIEKAMACIEPKDPMVKYVRLFSDNDFDLYEYEDGTDYEAQNRALEVRRCSAIQEILDAGGIAAVSELAKIVKGSGKVGWALGRLQGSKRDAVIFPSYLDIRDDAVTVMLKGYIEARYMDDGAKWVHDLHPETWKEEDKQRLLILMPFEKNTWERAREWLKAPEREYWKTVRVNPYHSKEDLVYAVRKLLDVSRYVEALNCIHVQHHLGKVPVAPDLIVEALLGAVKEGASNVDGYWVKELIKDLQNESAMDPEIVRKIEWAYLSFINSFDDVTPVFLSRELSTSPEFFCEIIRLIFRPSGEEDKPQVVDEKTKDRATNAWRLLNLWRTPPGFQADGFIDGDALNRWLSEVRKLSEQSGHLDVAMLKAGEVMYHAPSDQDGMWMASAVAMALDRAESEMLRRGYLTRAYNSRGAHWVDPEGKPERALAETWYKRADVLDDRGFTRLATALRGLGESYEREGERIRSGLL